MEAKATSSGLVNITGLPDWSRSDRGGVDSEGNAIYYEVSPFSFLCFPLNQLLL